MASLEEIYEKIRIKKLKKLIEQELSEKEKYDELERQKLFMMRERDFYEKNFTFEKISLSTTSTSSSAAGGRKIIPLLDINCGCIEFGSFGDDGRYAVINYSDDFNLSTNNFTIEWFQFQLTGSSYPRVFQCGGWPSSLGVSIEPNGSDYSFYFWCDNKS